jgi:hypothetical protein
MSLSGSDTTKSILIGRLLRQLVALVDVQFARQAQPLATTPVTMTCTSLTRPRKHVVLAKHIAQRAVFEPKMLTCAAIGSAQSAPTSPAQLHDLRVLLTLKLQLTVCARQAFLGTRQQIPAMHVPTRSPIALSVPVRPSAQSAQLPT